MEKLILGGKEFIIRNFCEDDVYKPAKLLAYINNLIDDSGAMIPLRMRKIPKQEREWLMDMLSIVRLSRMVILFAESDDKIVGGAEVSLYSWRKEHRKEHIAEFSISIIKDYRGCGLGSHLLSRIIGMTEKNLKPKPTIIRLSVFSSNQYAIALYQKHGFKIISRISNRFEFDGQFVDEIIMLKSIKKGGERDDGSS